MAAPTNVQVLLLEVIVAILAHLLQKQLRTVCATSFICTGIHIFWGVPPFSRSQQYCWDLEEGGTPQKACPENLDVSANKKNVSQTELNCFCKVC